MIQYKKMSLFDAPKGSILVHSVNSKGVFGAGIAAEFKRLYPLAFRAYEADCRYYDYPSGHGIIYNANEHFMGCLFTSDGYGSKIDNERIILKNTENALYNLLIRANDIKKTEIYSNKFNSGLFKVPWSKSEKLLIKALEKYPNINWTVCDLD